MKQGLIILGPQGSGKTTIVQAFADLLTSAYGTRHTPKAYDSFESFDRGKNLPVTAIVVIEDVTDLPSLRTITETYKDYRFIFTSSTLDPQPFDLSWSDVFQTIDLRQFFGTKTGWEAKVFKNPYILHTGLEVPYDHVYRDAIKLLPSLKLLEIEKVHQQDVGNADAVEMVNDEIRDRTSFEDSPCEGCGQLNSDCQCGPGQRDRNEEISNPKRFAPEGESNLLKVAELLFSFSQGDFMSKADAKNAAHALQHIHNENIKSFIAAPLKGRKPYSDAERRNRECIASETWRANILGDKESEKIEDRSIISQIERIDQSIVDWRKLTTELLNDIKNG